MTPPENDLRDAVARDMAEPLTPEEMAEIEAADPFRQPAPPPIPVRDRYYLTECEHCGWVGSSEQCSNGGGPDYDDIICAGCHQSICGDGPNEADTAKHGQAVFDRITVAEAGLGQAAKERDGCAELAGEAYADLAKTRADLERVTAERDAVLASQRYWSGEARRAADLLSDANCEIERLKHALDVANNDREAEATRLKAERHLTDKRIRAQRASLRQAWGIIDKGQLSPAMQRHRRFVVELFDRLRVANGEREEARETNRRLHRRLQAAEGPTVARAADTECAAAFWFKRRKAAGRRNSALRAEATRLRALLVDAGEALRPFVRHYDPRWMDDWADHEESTSFSRVTFGDLRRARSALAALDKAPTPKEPA